MLQQATDIPGILSWEKKEAGPTSFGNGQANGAPPLATPDGDILSKSDWEAKKDDYLPNVEDGDFLNSLMKPCWERGAYANWIAAPKVGIDNKPGDFEYVKIHQA